MNEGRQGGRSIALIGSAKRAAIFGAALVGR